MERLDQGHLHSERSRDWNVSAGNRTRVSTAVGGEHLAKSCSNSILLAIWNIYIWSRDNQCRNDPKSRIRIRNKSFRIHKTEILLQTEDTFPSYLLHSCPKFHWIFWMLLLLTTLVPFWQIFCVSSSGLGPDWFFQDSDLIFDHLSNRSDFVVKSGFGSCQTKELQLRIHKSGYLSKFIVTS